MLQRNTRVSWSALYVFALVVLAPLLALAPMRLAIGVVGLLGAAGLAWAGPIWGVYAVVLSVPVQQLVVLPSGISVTQAAVLLMAGAWVLRALATPHRTLVIGPLFWAWLALIGALLLSAAATPYSPTESLKATLRWVLAFLVWFVAVNSVERSWHVWALVACLLAGPTVAGVIGLVQFAGGFGPPSFRISDNLPFVRAYGTIGQPNSFAGYMNMAWPLATALGVGAITMAYRRKTTTLVGLRFALPLVLSAFITGMALLVSFSLGGWVGALVGVVGLLAASGRRWAWTAFGGVGVLAVFLFAGGSQLLPGAIAGRLTRLTGMLNFFDPATVAVTPENFSLVERMAQMKAGVTMFLAHPLLGVGPGSYSLAYGDVAQAPWYASRGHAHNFYLHMAAETGVLGFIAYVALLGTLVALAVQALRRTQDIYSHAAIVGCCGMIAAVAGHNLFENLHVLNLGIQMAGTWALVTLLARRPITDSGGLRT